MRHVSRGQWRTMMCWPAVWKIISRSNYINVSISDCLRGVRQLPFRIPGFTIGFYLLLMRTFLSCTRIKNFSFFLFTFENVRVNDSSFEKKEQTMDLDFLAARF